MPIDVDFLEGGRIIRVTMTDPLTMREVQEAFVKDLQHRDSADDGRKIHAIIDTLALRRLPPGVLEGRRSPSLIHPTSGQVVVVGASPFVQTISETVFRLVRFERVLFLASADEALRYLNGVIADEDQASPQPPT
jgi:hypothetical protein